MSRQGRPNHDASLEAGTLLALMWASFPVFLLELTGTQGERLNPPGHLLRWAQLIEREPRLVLFAPRGFGKTTLVVGYLLWLFWRHGRDETGRLLPQPRGTFQAVVFSATGDQALVFVARFRDLLVANEVLFPEFVRPRRRGLGRREGWSQKLVRLDTGAELLVRSYGTSTRGLHPDVLVLDDVLNDTNSQTSDQRDKTWRHFTNVLLPMHPGRFVALGTAFHQRDLLHALGDGRGREPHPDHGTLGFFWIKFPALLDETGEPLWPDVYPTEWLTRLRDHDPVAFACNYQNEPVDDAASMFPHEVTQRALDAGVDLVLGTAFPAEPDEVVLLAADFARSERASADFSVVIVAAVSRRTGHRRVLDIRRQRGLEFRTQIDLIRDLFVRHRVFLGVLENNGFQQWALDELVRWPETRGRVFPHTTTGAKHNRHDGFPSLKLEFLAGRWIVPTGDAASLRLARLLQSELTAMRYIEGRVSSVAEHDDLAITAWLLERAVAKLDEWFAQARAEEVIYGEDLGIERVHIGNPYL